MRRVVFLGVSDVTTASGRGPSASLLGFLSIYAHALCRRTTEFDVVTRGGGECISGSATPPIPVEWNSSAAQFFWILLYYAYTF